MDLLKGYGNNSDEDGEIIEEHSKSDKYIVKLPSINLAPSVITIDGNQYKGGALVDPKTKELTFNPKYEELYQPEVIFNILIVLHHIF